MSLLPSQILPPNEPIGTVDEAGQVIPSFNFYLLLYNLWLNTLGNGTGLPADALIDLASADSDAIDSDAIALRRPLSSADTVAQVALLTADSPLIPPTDPVTAQVALLTADLMPTQSVDAGASPVFLAVKLGSTLRATPVAGYLESDGNLFYLTDASLTRASIQRTMFTQIASVTVANTVTETTLIGAGVGSVTLPANYGLAGKALLLEGFGYHSATGNPTIRIRIYKGATLLLDTTAVTSGNSTNNLIQIRAHITWRSTTSLFAQGFYQESGGGSNNFEMVNTAATTVNTTSEALNMTLTWGTANAGNTVTLTNLSIRECN